MYCQLLTGYCFYMSWHALQLFAKRACKKRPYALQASGYMTDFIPRSEEGEGFFPSIVVAAPHAVIRLNEQAMLDHAGEITSEYEISFINCILNNLYRLF